MSLTSYRAAPPRDVLYVSFSVLHLDPRIKSEGGRRLSRFAPKPCTGYRAAPPRDVLYVSLAGWGPAACIVMRGWWVWFLECGLQAWQRATFPRLETKYHCCWGI